MLIKWIFYEIYIEFPINTCYILSKEFINTIDATYNIHYFHYCRRTKLMDK